MQKHYWGCPVDDPHHLQHRGQVFPGDAALRLTHSPAHQWQALPLVCCRQLRLLELQHLLSPLVLVAAAALPALPVPDTGGSEHGHQNLKPSAGMEALGSNW